MIEKIKIKKQLSILIKSILYRIYSSLITFLISYLITHKASVGLFISVADFVIKIFTYYFYEYVWQKIKSIKNKSDDN